jgi:high-affinity Fe2+/Pb2+ permease
MLDRLDRISDRTAYLVAAIGVAISLVAAFLVPQDVELGAWVRLVIWHGMLSAAAIVGIFAMGFSPRRTSYAATTACAGGLAPCR